MRGEAGHSGGGKCGGRSGHRQYGVCIVCTGDSVDVVLCCVIEPAAAALRLTAMSGSTDTSYGAVRQHLNGPSHPTHIHTHPHRSAACRHDQPLFRLMCLASSLSITACCEQRPHLLVTALTTAVFICHASRQGQSGHYHTRSTRRQALPHHHCPSRHPRLRPAQLRQSHHMPPQSRVPSHHPTRHLPPLSHRSHRSLAHCLAQARSHRTNARLRSIARVRTLDASPARPLLPPPAVVPAAALPLR